MIYEHNLTSIRKVILDNESYLEKSLFWYNNFFDNFNKISINLAQYLKDPSTYESYLQIKNSEESKTSYIDVRKRLLFDGNLDSEKIFLRIGCGDNKLITFSLDPITGLLYLKIKNFNNRHECLLIKKKIIKETKDNRLFGFFRHFEINISSKNDRSKKGILEIFRENYKWGIKIIFYHKSFMGKEIVKRQDVIDIMTESYFFNYVLNEIIFFVLGKFTYLGFETMWNKKDKAILWRYMIKKYHRYNLGGVEMTEDDLKKISKKLKKSNRPKSKSSIKELYNTDKSRFSQNILENKLDYLKVYLLESFLAEDNHLQNYFSNVDFKFSNK